MVLQYLENMPFAVEFDWQMKAFAQQPNCYLALAHPLIVVGAYRFELLRFLQ